MLVLRESYSLDQAVPTLRGRTVRKVMSTLCKIVTTICIIIVGGIAWLVVSLGLEYVVKNHPIGFGGFWAGMAMISIAMGMWFLVNELWEPPKSR